MSLLAAYNEIITISCVSQSPKSYAPVRLVATPYKDKKRAHLMYWKKAQEYAIKANRYQAQKSAQKLARRLGIQFDFVAGHGMPCRPEEQEI